MKVRKICSLCGSPQIQIEILATWDEGSQAWKPHVIEEDRKADCTNCDSCGVTVKDVSLDPVKTKEICPVCESDEISFDASAHWNVETQGYVMGDAIFDKSGYCNNCEANGFRSITVDAETGAPVE